MRLWVFIGASALLPQQQARVRRLSLPGSLLLCAAIGSACNAAELAATPGKDGAGGTLTGIVNTYYPGTANAAAGATTISVGAPSGAATAISAGDLLLVIQMQDAAINSTNTSSYGDGVAGDYSGSTALNSTGKYEYVVATGAVAGGSVPIRGAGAGTGLLNSYDDAAATGAMGQRQFQVIRVPQYTTATLSSGLTALAWNGTVGGVLVIDVAYNLTLGGTVSVDGLGFRGGGGQQLTGGTSGNNTDYRSVSTTSGARNCHGNKGEGIAGTPRYVYDGANVVNTGVEGYPNGSRARGAPGNAGGGATDGDPDTPSPGGNDENSGGGGGANGGAGGFGGNSWNSNLAVGGHGGAAFPASSSTVIMGGGGGSGSRNNSSGNMSSGGVGGGIVMIRSGTVSGAGTISADGATGVTPLNDGGGGGGAGGSVVVSCLYGTLSGLTVTVQGGRGTDAWPTQAPNGNPGERHGPGGGGGGGVVFLSDAAASANVSGGANGTTTTAADPYGATPGSPGVYTVMGIPTAMGTPVPGAISGGEAVFSKLLVAAPGQSFVDGTGVTGTPLAQTAGIAFNATVYAVDFWKYQKTATDTVAITSTDPNATLPANAALVAGVKTFSVTLNTAGTWTLTATDVTNGWVRPGTSSPITVNAGAAAKIRAETAANGSGVVVPAQSVTSGNSITVYAITRDASNNFIANVAATWALLSKTGGVVDGDLVPSGDTKSAVFTGHVIGTAVIDAASGALAKTDSGTITVVAGAASKIRVETAANGSGVVVPAQNVASGNSITAYAITRDASNNFIANVAATWALLSKTGGVLDGDLVPSGDTKSAVFTGHLVGTAVIDAASGALPKTDSGTITVVAGAAAKLAFTTQPGGGTAGTAWAQQPQVTLQDALGNTVTGTAQNVTLAIQNNAGGGTLSGTKTVAVNTSTGVATFSGLSIDKAGTGYTLTATGSTVNTTPGVVVSGPFNITAGAMTQLVVTLPGQSFTGGSGNSGSSTNQTAGSPFNIVTLTATDAYFNIVTSYSGAKTISYTGPGGSPTYTTAVSFTNGQSTTALATTLTKAETTTITASDGTITGPASSPVTVVAGAFTKLQILVPGETAAPGTASGHTGSPSSEPAGTPFNATVNAVDAWWNLVSTVADTVAITSGDDDAVLPPNAALFGGTGTFSVTLNTLGTETVTASDVTNGSKTPDTVSVVATGTDVVSFDLAASSGLETVTPALIAVSLSRETTSTVTVNYAVTGGTAVSGVNYTLAPGTLTFDPGDETKNIAVTIIHDGVCTPDLTIQLTLSNPVNAGLGAITVHTHTIIDADLVITARETQDLNGDGFIDAIRIVTNGPLNDNFTGLNITVSGYTVSGYSTGAGANDNEFFVLLNEGATPDTGVKPGVQVVSAGNLKRQSSVEPLPTDSSPVTPTDKAKPVLMSALWNDGSFDGVDAGDTITLTFSEPVTASGVQIGDIGTPVSNDELAASSISNQGPNTQITMILATDATHPEIRLTPGGTYDHQVLTPGSPTGVFVNDGSHIQDGALNTALNQTFNTAVDLLPGDTLLRLTWDDSSIDDKAWALGNEGFGVTRQTNTDAIPLILIAHNAGNVRMDLSVSCANTAVPSGWTLATTASVDKFESKLVDGATVQDLATGAKGLVSAMYSGHEKQFDLRLVMPTDMTVWSGVQQTVTVTLTATQH